MSDLHAPFAGTLYLPDKAVPRGTSPVRIPDGTTIARIQWHMWTARSRFEILEPNGAVVANGGSEGFTARNYYVRAPDGGVLVHIKQGAWRPINGAILTLTGGRRLGIKQSYWSGRHFEFQDPQGQPVGRISPTTGVFTFHPDSYAFELFWPAMSIVETIGLAQSLRTIVHKRRNQRRHDD